MAAAGTARSVPATRWSSPGSTPGRAAPTGAEHTMSDHTADAVIDRLESLETELERFREENERLSEQKLHSYWIHWFCLLDLLHLPTILGSPGDYLSLT